MQVLTWGTIAGPVASAVLLAALDSPMGSHLSALQRIRAFMRPSKLAPSGHSTKPDEDRSRRGDLALPKSWAPLRR